MQILRSSHNTYQQGDVMPVNDIEVPIISRQAPPGMVRLMLGPKEETSRNNDEEMHILDRPASQLPYVIGRAEALTTETKTGRIFNDKKVQLHPKRPRP